VLGCGGAFCGRVALSRWRRRPRVRRTAWRDPVRVSRPRTCARAARNLRPACRALTCSTHGPPASYRAQQNMTPASVRTHPRNKCPTTDVATTSTLDARRHRTVVSLPSSPDLFGTTLDIVTQHSPPSTTPTALHCMLSYCPLRTSKPCSYCIVRCLHSCACLHKPHR
jgi:hypothetical protein